MKYVEMLGMPGSGKSTLLRYLRDRGFAGRAGKTILSEDWEMVSRRLGYRCGTVANGPESGKPSLLSRDMLKSFLHDNWQMGIFSQYADLFAEIFQCLATVPAADRERSILLNYWRSRISLYMDVSRRDSETSCIVDEGLAQSVLSTMTRMSVASNRKHELVSSLLRRLPPERTVVLLQTPRELILRRRQASRETLTQDWSRKSEEVEFIFQQEKKLGRDTVILDGTLSINSLCTALEAHFGRATDGYLS